MMLYSFFNFIRLYAGDDLFSSKFKVKLQDSFLKSQLSKIHIEEMIEMTTDDNRFTSRDGLFGKPMESIGDSQMIKQDNRVSRKGYISSIEEAGLVNDKISDTNKMSHQDQLENSLGIELRKRERRIVGGKVNSGSRFDYSRSQLNLMRSTANLDSPTNKAKLQPILMPETELSHKKGHSPHSSHSISQSNKFEIRKFSLKQNFVSKPLLNKYTEDSLQRKGSSSSGLRILQQNKSQKIQLKSKFGNMSSSNFNIRSSSGIRNSEESSITPKSKNFQIQLNAPKELSANYIVMNNSNGSPDKPRKIRSIFDQNVVLRSHKHKNKINSAKSGNQVFTNFSQALQNITFSKRFPFQPDIKIPKERLVSFSPFSMIQSNPVKDAEQEEHQKLQKRNIANRRIRILQSSINQLEKDQKAPTRAVLVDSPRKVKIQINKL